MDALSETRFIITGGPGSGRTAIIEALRLRGYCCVDEVGRKIIQEQMRIGGDAVHWGGRAKYLELMLSRSIADYDRVAGKAGAIFFDRGIPSSSATAGWWTSRSRGIS
jgi:predicted ATPase